MVSAQLWVAPALILLKLSPPFTATGRRRSLVLPSPSWPSLPFAAVLILGSRVLGWLSIEDEMKMVKDFSLSGISVLVALLAMLVGASSIAREVERRTVYTVLSRDCGRGEFLRLNVAYALSYGGMLTFITAFLRSHENLDERVILVVLGSFFLGGLISPWLAGSRLDRLGSRPALRLALGLGAILSLV